MKPAIAFLEREAAPDELVYHNFWWDFSSLYHYRPDGRYVVALDPVYFYRKDPERFAAALSAFEGRTVELYRVLKKEFGATWVFLPKEPRNERMFNLIRHDPRFTRAYEDQRAVIVRLGTPIR